MSQAIAQVHSRVAKADAAPVVASTAASTAAIRPGGQDEGEDDQVPLFPSLDDRLEERREVVQFVRVERSAAMRSG